MFRVNLVGGGFLAIIMMVYHVGVMAEVYRDISIDRFKSRYLKKFNVGSITFATAQAACASYGGTLAIFPSANEMDTLWDILSMDLKMSADKIQSHRYWVGLKYHNTSRSGVHWVNTVNENFISASKWDFIDKIGWDNNSQIADEEGCMALEFSWHQSSLTVRSLIKHVSCDPTTTTPVKSYLCEKAEEGTLSFKFWNSWKAWSADNCQEVGAIFATRERMCFGYSCELQGMPSMIETKVCCPVLPTVSKGFYQNRFAMLRAYENQITTLNCDDGHVHPDTRYHITNSTCVADGSGVGMWTPATVTECSPVDCGIPPLGVHAYPPKFTGTQFQDVVTYQCQPGFKEPKNNESRVTLRCANSDTWVGVNYDPTIKAVCQPIENILLPWIYYPGNGNCYQLHHLGSTWEEASDTCDGDILYLTDEEEFQFLVNDILEPQAERSVLWLAGKKKTSDTSFSWYINRNLTTPIGSYTTWDEGGPLSTPYHRELCIAANYSEGEWKWTNQTCDNKFEFVCKTTKHKTHGDWSDWTEWTVCDRHFVRKRRHVCNNPSPSCGGDMCLGDEIEESFCCQDPGKAPNANISYRSIDNNTVFLLPGHYYTYDCAWGYEHVGGGDLKNITCQLDGKWSDPGTAPPCTAKRCIVPAHGTYSSYYRGDPTKKYEHESVLNYNCLPGFAAGQTANSPKVGLIRCLDGEWDGPPLPCYAKLCDGAQRTELTDRQYDDRHINRTYVRHLDVRSHESWGWNDTENDTDLYNDIYQYFCTRGYRVLDRIDYNITCTETGEWKRGISASSSLHPVTCEAVKCQGPPPQAITNSLWSGGINPNDPSVLGEYLDTAHYNCTPGYQVNTGIKNDSRVLLTYTFTCRANNDWKDEYSPQNCKKQSCGDPGPGTNVENRVGRSFLFGDTIDYVCRRGYIYDNMITRRRLLCELPPDGTLSRWNDTELNCTKVVCGNPGSGSNVTKKGTNYLYGGVVSYTCVPQHVLTGGGLEKLWIRCTSQGTWNGSAPSCEPAEISSDFSIRTFKPYAVEAQWIMSEKYKTIQTTFKVEYSGKPGYMERDGTFSYITNVSELITHTEMHSISTAESGLIKTFLYTKPEYIYKFKLHSQTRVSSEMWPENKPGLTVYTGGGLPFLGAVERARLPNIIPIDLLPKHRRRPQAQESGSPNAIRVSFDRSMFSEENGTIIGFTIIVKEVHPWHLTDKLMYREGYHERYPEALFTWRELEVFTDYKYVTWPAYYAFPACNIFDPTAKCSELTGLKPTLELNYSKGIIDPSLWRESVYTNFPSEQQLPSQKVDFHIGLSSDCETHDAKYACNGPLRRNRKFCVKLRAYTRYGWNDSECSNWIAVDKQLEFDESLIIPTVLAAAPFAIFIMIVCYTGCKDVDYKAQIAADHDIAEGELISIWNAQSQHQRVKGYNTRERKKASPNKAKAKGSKSSVVADSGGAGGKKKNLNDTSGKRRGTKQSTKKKQ